MPPVQFATQAYTSRSLPLAAQRAVNVYTERAPQDAKSTVALFGSPGLKLFATAGDGPIRAIHEMDGILYAVSGANLFSIDSAGTATDRGALWGSNSRVAMSHNGTAGGNELIIVDGTVQFQDGYFIFSESAHGYTYTVAGGLAVISDTDFGVATAQQFQLSNLNSGTAYTATDVATAEGANDDLLAVVSDHREVWLFGEETIEVWYNSGDADFPFDRLSGSFIERGLAAKYAVISDFDNTIAWLGDDRVVYRAEGFLPVRISTHAIETAFEKYTTISDAFAFEYTQDGHKFFVLTFPTEAATWVYDVASGLWHERESRDSGGVSLGRWRANCYAKAYGKHLVGDFADGRIGELDLATYDEYGNVMVGNATSPPWHYDRKTVRMPLFELDVESGIGLTSGQGSAPQIMLDWSDDGGFTYGPLQQWRSMGAIGARKTRLRWRRMGKFRERIMRVTISDPIKRSIIAAHAELSVGLH